MLQPIKHKYAEFKIDILGCLMLTCARLGDIESSRKYEHMMNDFLQSLRNAN